MRIDKNTTIRLGDRNIVKIKIVIVLFGRRTTSTIYTFRILMQVKTQSLSQLHNQEHQHQALMQQVLSVARIN